MKWRIRTDRYAGYTVQAKYGAWPFWRLPFYEVNTFRSLEDAETYIARKVRERDFTAETVKEISA